MLLLVFGTPTPKPFVHPSEQMSSSPGSFPQQPLYPKTRLGISPDILSLPYVLVFIAAITNHKLSGLKQMYYLMFWSSEV